MNLVQTSNMKNKIFIIGLFSLIIVGCSHNTPKPYGYFRIDLPKNEYVTFDSTYPPCTMEISKWAQVVPRSSTKTNEDFVDIIYPNFNGKIYCSYVALKSNLHQVSEDSRKLVYKHTVRADAIIEHPFENKGAKVYGILYELTGNAASPIQFVLTDSIHHFLRGALYFNAVPNADSIAPVSAFVEKDLKHLVETVRWK